MYDSRVILEEMIEGFEVGCAILGTEQPMIGEVDEIELAEGFFDYTEKYTLETSKIHVPARITAEKAEEIKHTALAIYKALGCSDFARVDISERLCVDLYDASGSNCSVTWVCEGDRAYKIVNRKYDASVFVCLSAVSDFSVCYSGLHGKEGTTCIKKDEPGLNLIWPI